MGRDSNSMGSRDDALTTLNWNKGDETMRETHSWPPKISLETVRTGIPGIDRITGGAQPGEIWALAGEPSSGKTFLMCRLGLGAVTLGFTTLFLSMEMTNRQVGERFLSMLSHVNPSNLRDGKLSYFAIRQVHEKLTVWEAQGHNGRLILIEGRINMSVDDVQGAIQEHKPDIVFIDGASMLLPNGTTPNSREERIADMLKQLEQSAIRASLPIICSFHAETRTRGDKRIWRTTADQTMRQISSTLLFLSDDATEEDRLPRLDGTSFKMIEILKRHSTESKVVRMQYNMDRLSIEQAS